MEMNLYENMDKKNSEPEFGDELTQNQLRDAVEEYANWYINNNSALDEVDLEKVTFSISSDFKRAAGKTGWEGEKSNQMLRMAWKAYQKWGWNEEFTDTIKHELIHIWQIQVYGEANHGRTFKRKQSEIDAPRHCPQFAEYEYIFYCTECGEQNGGRFQKSKIVKSVLNNESLYQSGCCGAKMRVET